MVPIPKYISYLLLVLLTDCARSPAVGPSPAGWVTQFLEAISRGDSARVEELADTQLLILQLIRELDPAFQQKPESVQEEVFRTYATQFWSYLLSHEARARARERGEPQVVKVAGEGATVEVTDGGNAVSYALWKTAQGWQIISVDPIRAILGR